MSKKMCRVCRGLRHDLQ